MAKRRQNFQPISWFWDLFTRELLDMDPPYQRRSVWTPRYREEFIDTLLLDYPVPAIFLFSRVVSESGVTRYEVVDGKQRLTTVFMFVKGEIAVSDESPVERFRGKYFEDLPEDQKLGLWQLDFPVEYLPTNDEGVVNDIFKRINKNIAKLTNQELRHAQYSGRFISRAEELATWIENKLDPPFPRVVDSSRRQMKDVEIVATLLLFLEIGPRRMSPLEMDEAFASRDIEWDREEEIVGECRDVIGIFSKILDSPGGDCLPPSRFMNQADFYSLFAAIAELRRENNMPEPRESVARLEQFIEKLSEDGSADSCLGVSQYLDAARSGSHDTNQRRIRIAITKHVLSGNDIEDWKAE